MRTTMTIYTIERGPVEVRYFISSGNERLIPVDENPPPVSYLLPDECPEGEYARVIEAFRASPEGARQRNEYREEEAISSDLAADIEASEGI